MQRQTGTLTKNELTLGQIGNGPLSMDPTRWNMTRVLTIATALGIHHDRQIVEQREQHNHDVR